MENKYYIYAHINPLKNEIFYIGKGCRYRAYDKVGRSNWWKKTVDKYGYIINLLEEGLTDEEAIEREKYYINKIGRLDLGTGSLVNMTDGGEGVSGRVLSEETKKKISESHKGKTFSKETLNKMSESGKNKPPVSDETKKKLSEAGKGRIPVNVFKKGHISPRKKYFTEEEKLEAKRNLAKLRARKYRAKLKQNKNK